MIQKYKNFAKVRNVFWTNGGNNSVNGTLGPADE